MKQTLILIAISLLAKHANAQLKNNYHQYGIHTGYLLSSNNKNVKNNKPLFAGNAINFGASHRWGSKLGIYTMAQYTIGKIDKESLNNFAKNVAGGSAFEITKISNSWSQLSILTGPSLQFFPKYPFNINFLGGVALLPNRNNIKIIGNSLTPIFNSTENSITPVWNINANVSLLRVTKKMDLGLSMGYGTNGFSLGIVASDTYAICCRYNQGCCPK